MPSGHNKHLADSRAATPVSNSAKFVQLELTAIGIFLVQLAKTMLRFGAFPVCFLLFRFWFTGLTAIYKLLRNSSRYNCQNKINQPWLTMLVMTTMWSTGRHQQSWTGNLTGAPSGSRRRYISERRDGVQWTRMRAATHWATHTTDFLLRHITTVTRTGTRTEQASSDEGLW